MNEEVRACGKCGNPATIPDDEMVKAIVDAAGSPLCEACFDDWCAEMEANKRPEPTVEQRQSPYVFSSDMGEISGFGGGYEQTCRNMLAAGLEWFDANPNANPKYKGFEEIYGLISEDNADAEALSKAVVSAADNDCTDAMHQAVVSSCLWIRNHSWEEYCDEMKAREQTA